MVENHAFEPEEGATLPRLKSRPTPNIKGRPGCNNFTIALGVLCIVVLATALVVIVVHLQTGAQWRQGKESSAIVFRLRNVGHSRFGCW